MDSGHRRGAAWPAAVVLAGLVLLVPACAQETWETGSTSLPLQQDGLAIGGDVQSRATDRIGLEITDEQAQEIATACNAVAVVDVAASGADDCSDVMMRIVGDGGLGRCTGGALCLRVYDVAALPEFGDGGIIEVVDERPLGSSCADGPRGVCLRVGVRTTRVLDEILGVASTSTGTPTPTFTPTPTPTPSPTPTPTPSPTPTPTATGTSTAPASSSAGAPDAAGRPSRAELDVAR